MITDDRLKWLSGPDYARSEPGQIAAELLAARATIERLRGKLKAIHAKSVPMGYDAGNAVIEALAADALATPSETEVWPCPNCGTARSPHYLDCPTLKIKGVE